MSKVYQKGSIRKVKRARGRQVWEWRYRLKGVMKQETFELAAFPSKGELWAHLETRLRLLNVGGAMSPPPTMADLIKKYRDKHLPGLAKSTREAVESLLRTNLEPRWAGTLVADVHAEDVQDWLTDLRRVDGAPLSSSTRGRARRLMKHLLDKAMFWRMIPTAVNPITLVRVKGATLRQKRPVILTIAQVNALISALPKPYSLMVLTASSLGLRCEEVVALQWNDFDFEARTVTINRAFTHGELKDVKSEASNGTLPIEGVLLTALLEHRTQGSPWLFPSPVTGGPLSGPTILSKRIKPAATALGLPNMGWHTLRHSFKSWQGSSTAKPAELKDLLRHSSITTTMDVYGGTPVEVMRQYVAAIASELRYDLPIIQ